MNANLGSYLRSSSKGTIKAFLLLSNLFKHLDTSSSSSIFEKPIEGKKKETFSKKKLTFQK